MTAWSTPAQAAAITNKAVSQDELDSAQVVIDIYSNVTVEASAGIGARNVRLLRYAVAWQAVWQASRVDFGTGMDVDHVTQDGQTFSKGSADAHLLSPMARKCLFKLSWNKSRTLDPLSQEEAVSLKYGGDWGGPQPGVSGNEDWLDDQGNWEPM